MVENEFAAPGWKADRDDIRPVVVAGALRGWVLPAGRYRFTASYAQPERTAQITLAALALLAWGIAKLIYRRWPPHGSSGRVSNTIQRESSPRAGR